MQPQQRKTTLLREFISSESFLINCPRLCTLTPTTDDDVDGKLFNALIQFPHIIHSIPRKRVHRSNSFPFLFYSHERDTLCLVSPSRLIEGGRTGGWHRWLYCSSLRLFGASSSHHQHLHPHMVSPVKPLRYVLY